jgi:hypothetical protein
MGRRLRWLSKIEASSMFSAVTAGAGFATVVDPCGAVRQFSEGSPSAAARMGSCVATMRRDGYPPARDPMQAICSALSCATHFADALRRRRRDIAILSRSPDRSRDARRVSPPRLRQGAKMTHEPANQIRMVSSDSF